MQALMAEKTSANDEAASWLSLDQAARQVRLSRTTLYRMLIRGRVPHHRFGRLIRIHRDDLKGFVASQRFAECWTPYGSLPTEGR
jgi:excisionase family DNA binding protein